MTRQKKYNNNNNKQKNSLKDLNKRLKSDISFV